MTLETGDSIRNVLHRTPFRVKVVRFLSFQQSSARNVIRKKTTKPGCELFLLLYPSFNQMPATLNPLVIGHLKTWSVNRSASNLCDILSGISRRVSQLR